MKAENPGAFGPLTEGTILGNYVVGPVLGQGGFGVVYRCSHLELESTVAIKEYFPAEFAVRERGSVYPRSTTNSVHFEDGLRRFIKEGRQLEAFRNCPAIVTCRDLFPANGTAYMVMDLVPGMPLSELLSRRESNGQPFTEKDLLLVLQPLLEGLRTVHAADVYHRDIKPSNVLIRHDDGRPVLIDFGAAKQTATGLTKSIAPYTEGYAAPEQVGEGRIGPWTDVYGVGAVAWRMIAGGSPPWSPPNPVPVQRRLYSKFQDQTDPMPSAVDLGKGRFSLPLLQAVDGCLVMAESGRIQTGEVLLERMRGAVSGPTSPPKVVAGRSIRQKDVPPKSPSQHRIAKPRKWTRAKTGLVIAAITCVPVIGFALSSVLQDDSPSPGSGALVSSSSSLPPTQPTTRYAALTVFGAEGTPRSTRFVISDGLRTYSNGSQLPPGDYTIRASAPGFRDYERVVTHGRYATQTRVVLKRIPATTADEPIVADNFSGTQRTEPQVSQRRPAAQGSAVRGLGSATQDRSGSAADGQASRSSTSWPHVTRNTVDSRVIAVLGAPDRKVIGTSTETWYYGRSTVTIDAQTRRVRSWYDSGENRAVSQAGAQGRSGSAASRSNSPGQTTFRRGSHEDEVRRIQGNPDRRNRRTTYTEWFYGRSIVRISQQTRRVTSWTNTDNNLKVTPSGSASATSSTNSPGNSRNTATTFRRGSHEREVRQALGEPDKIAQHSQYEAWFYGRSFIVIDAQTRKVRSWTIVGKELMETSSGVAIGTREPVTPSSTTRSSSTFMLGSSETEVRRVQGAPDAIEVRGLHESWSYGRSVVTISTQTRRVIAWKNLDGKLKGKGPLEGKEYTTFTHGSHEDEVIRLQGEPDKVERRFSNRHDVLYYGRSTVRIDKETRLVLSWNKSDQRLKVR